MRGTGKLLMTTALLAGALLSVMAAVSPEVASSTRESTVKVAMAQPLTAMDGSSLVAVPRQSESNPTLPESGMLVVVGSVLLGLAALVRRNT